MEAELRRHLRWLYRNYALNSYGKLISELKLEEKRNILDWLLKDQQVFYTSGREREKFRAAFKEVFLAELKAVGRTS